MHWTTRCVHPPFCRKPGALCTPQNNPGTLHRPRCSMPKPFCPLHPPWCSLPIAVCSLQNPFCTLQTRFCTRPPRPCCPQNPLEFSHLQEKTARPFSPSTLNNPPPSTLFERLILRAGSDILIGQSRQKPFELLLTRQMRRNRSNEVAISPQPRAITLLRIARKMLASHHFPHLHQRLIPLHGPVLIQRQPFVYY